MVRLTMLCVEGRVDGSLLVLAGTVALALAQTEH